ncbi:MAG TPA: hypothetical protein P5059_00765 [Candidatus Dojkabacteria bacterium]|nr:hypothetical protein [Candidatus Dojkabacteria bacterium]
MNTFSNLLKRESIKNSKIFWDTPKERINQLSDEAKLERILNYGDMNQLRKVLKAKKDFQKEYYKLRNKKRTNLSPLVINYIDLYLKKNP